jgi:hypothetical protein
MDTCSRRDERWHIVGSEWRHFEGAFVGPNETKHKDSWVDDSWNGRVLLKQLSGRPGLFEPSYSRARTAFFSVLSQSSPT